MFSKISSTDPATFAPVRPPGHGLLFALLPVPLRVPFLRCVVTLPETTIWSGSLLLLPMMVPPPTTLAE